MATLEQFIIGLLAALFGQALDHLPQIAAEAEVLNTTTLTDVPADAPLEDALQDELEAQIASDPGGPPV